MASHSIAVFTGPGRVELRDDPEIEPGPGEVVVRLRACALCTMEQRLWRGAQDNYPIAAGHEAAGEVVRVHPEGVLNVEPGDRVALAFLDRCFQCDACRRGETHLCTGKLAGRAPGRLRRIGGLADIAVVPAWKLFRMPAQRSFEEIALCEPVACVVHSIDKAGLRFGDDVLVVGSGTMGRLHLMLARLRGTRVFLSDPSPERRRAALEHGAHGAFAPEDAADEIQRATDGRGADAVFVTFGALDTARQAADAVRRGGRIIYYGGFPAGIETQLDAGRLHREEQILTGARAQTLADWHQASRLIAAGLLDVRPLITDRYPLDRLAQALDAAVDPVSLRIMVLP